ncbi:MAG: hypothetical protein ACJAY2_003470 [Pseudomonadales bacterium]|jgi:hypothetical protein
MRVISLVSGEQMINFLVLCQLARQPDDNDCLYDNNNKKKAVAHREIGVIWAR